MQTLKEIFEAHAGRLLHKWDHYFDVYEKYFAPYRGKPVTILEIGISHGGSLQMWRKYFGEQATIFAVDINPECAKFLDTNTKIFIGSQEDEVFLNELKNQLPPLDILIDDGGHTMKQQILTFKHLFSLVKDGGIYLTEDTHTSYWNSFGGGYKRKGTFIEFAKKLIDQMHAWHINNKRIAPVNELTKSITGIAFYDSMVVFEKHQRSEPFHSMKGTATINDYEGITLKKPSIVQQVRKKLLPDDGNSFFRQLKK